MRALRGAGLDIAAYGLAVGLAHSSPECAQLLSFGIAVALGYLPRVRGWTMALHVIVVTLLAFFLRSGLLAVALENWGWPGLAAIVPAAALTLLVLRAGYGYCASSAQWRFGHGAGWQQAAIGITFVAVALRLFYCGRVELLPEEAYYWNYARHLDIGYLDHPPMVAWLIEAGTLFFGDGEFGVRVGALCAGAIETWFIYRLTRNLFGAPSGLVAVVLLQTLPFFFLAGMLMTPDAPLSAAWAGSLFYLERALIAGRRDAWWRAGLCLGLGLLSKYTICLVGLSTLIFMVSDSQSRRWFLRIEPYGAALMALAVFSPVIVWNAHNEWASFLFQTSRRLADRPQFALHKLIASALVLLSPTGFAAAALALARSSSGGDAPAPQDDRRRARRFLRVATLTPLAIFALFSLRHEVKLDWTGVPWLAVVPAVAYGIVHFTQQVAPGMRSFIRSAWLPTLLVLLLVYGAGLYDLTWGIPHVGYGKHAELVPVGWRELGARTDRVAAAVAQQTGRAPVVVGMDRYAIASELAFYSPDKAQGVSRSSSAHLFGQVGLMYERWFPPAEEEGKTLLLVSWNRADLTTEQVVSAVERLGPIQEGILTRGEEVIRPYYYRIADGYLGAAEEGGPHLR